MSASYLLRCIECDAAYEPGPTRLVCSECAPAQEPGGATRGQLWVDMDILPRELSMDALRTRAGLAEYLPIRSAEHLAPLAVGGTPLLPVPRLRERLGLPGLWIKDDTRNPSGSTKDRASQLVVAKAIEYGFGTVAAASTGNAATALAACCASAGLRAVVFVPASAPQAKLVQMASYGAELVLVDGTYDQAFDLSIHACERYGWYNRNTALNPYTVEGKKTAGLEIAAQLLPQEADVVVVPVGDGVIISGLAKGFKDLVKAGSISRPPRLIAAQAEGSDAIFRALGAEGQKLESVRACSAADSLNVDVPRGGLQAIREISASNGAAVRVPEEALLAGIGELARGSGVFAEPSSATAFAALPIALEQGLIRRQETVVVLITGTGLKDVGAASRGLDLGLPIEPRLSALDGRFAS